MLTDVAAEVPGTLVREIDVAIRPELVRLLGHPRAPRPSLVVDPAGVELARRVGVPRRADLLGHPPAPAADGLRCSRPLFGSVARVDDRLTQRRAVDLCRVDSCLCRRDPAFRGPAVRPGRRASAPARRSAAVLVEVSSRATHVPIPCTHRTRQEHEHMSREDVLVTADWAEENLDAPDIVFVEVDEDTSAYDGGHIPGAVKIDWKTELQDPVRRDFVDQAGFEKLLSAKGIGNDDTVVLYGGNNNWFAAYAYWYFKLYGHDDVKLLDGGRKKWELDGRELDTEVRDRAGRPATRPRSRTPRSARSATRSSPPSAPRTWSTSARPTSSPASCSPRRTCRRSRRSAAATSRPRSTCRGARRPTRTARSGPTTSCASSTRRPGSTTSRPTIAYCRIGERSSHTWFALHELLGEQDVKNYDGSWTEYGSLVGVPVEIGATGSLTLMCGRP